MVDFVRVGIKIADLRRKHNLSQDNLADQLFVTRQALSKWENGISIPSIDTLIDLSKIFKVSFEEILCLNDNEDIIINEEDIFSGHERGYIISKIIANELNVNIPNCLYQFSPAERMLILKNIKEGIIKCDLNELMVKLNISEEKFLGGKVYEIEKSYN